MTFLEFVIRRYVGPPSSGRCWSCPWCEHPTPSLVVNEPMEGRATKFRCHRCTKWGDKIDVLWRFHPATRYPERCAIAAELRREWEAGVENEATAPSLPRGRRGELPISSTWADIRADAEARGLDPDRAIAEIAFALEADEIDPAEVPLTRGVVDYEYRFLDFQRRCDRHHRSICDETDCDADVCRVARGLPPMTRQERKDYGQRLAEEARRERERRRAEKQRRAEYIRANIDRIRPRRSRPSLNGKPK